METVRYLTTTALIFLTANNDLNTSRTWRNLDFNTIKVEALSNNDYIVYGKDVKWINPLMKTLATTKRPYEDHHHT